jgi:3-deoxy-D-manno-octulosonic-acid transferase
VLFDPPLVCWNLFLILACPVLLAMKARRATKKRSTHEFDLRRWSAFPPISSGETRPRVVFLAPSYGEVLLIEPITKALRQARSDVHIVWAVRDPHTLAQLHDSNRGVDAVPWPFDFGYPVAKWLAAYDPAVLVFTERFSFPNLVIGSRLWGSRLALVNGRAKRARHSVLRAYQAWLFRAFDVLLFQSEKAAKRAREILPDGRSVAATGNIKLDLVRRDLAHEQAEELARWLAPEAGPVLVAGSTGNAEEDAFVLEAFAKVRAKAPCRLLLAPRKLERAGECVQAAAAHGYTVSLRSGAGTSLADVYVLDSLGELAHAYGLGEAAYVGGSLNGMGHNVVEPLEWGVPVCYGPRRGHFQELQEACESAGVGFRVHTAAELAEHWLQALQDADFRKCVRDRATLMLRDQRGAVGRTVNALLELLPPTASSPSAP